MLEPLSKEKDGFGPAKLRIAAIQYRAGKRTDAYHTIDEILVRYPGNAQALESKSRMLIGDGNYDEVIKITTAVIAADPQAATSYYLRGIALTRKGSAKPAIADMQKALELVPSAIAAQVQLASLHIANNDAKSAIDLLNPLLKSQPRLVSLRMLMGEALLKVGDLQGAEAQLAPLEKGMPSSFELQMLLGRLHGAKGDLSASRKAFLKAVALQPNSIAAVSGLVTLDIVEKKPQDARARLESLLSKYPNDPALLFLAGNSYLTMRDMTRAESLFKKVIELSPNNLDAYARLGRLYWIQNRLDEARAQYEEAARHQARPVAIKTLLALILQLQNKDDEASKLYERCSR